jgi:2-desacetyl-2-hydroxyethyl bacteriochlorophyllide A dehydrogenase
MTSTDPFPDARMRALRWHGARDLRVDVVSIPEVGPNDALVRVTRVGLCGTDVEEYLTGPHDIPVDEPHHISGAIAPMIPGHELVGTVERCDSRPELVGMTVIPDVVQGCGRCWWCRRHEDGLCPDLVVLGQSADGGLAEFVRCRAATLVSVPSELSIDNAAFAEPVAVAVRAVAKAGDLRGCTVAVVGAGVVGNLIAQVARARGAQVVATDTAAWRLDVAAASGIATVPVETSSAQIAELTGGRMADVVFECAGRDASFALSATLARRGGAIVLVGIGNTFPAFPWRDVVLREQRLIGTAAHVWDVDVTTAVELLASGHVNPAPLISRIVGLDDVAATLEELTTSAQLAKVLVDPHRGLPERNQ